MPILNIGQTEQSYYLVAFDEKGFERADDPDGLMRQGVIDKLRDDAITDVILMSHGWLHDVPSAKSHYEDWFGAIAQCERDNQRLRENREFNPLYVALHWPSKPWGDESLVGDGDDDDVSFASPNVGGESPIDEAVQHYSEVFGGSLEVEAALRTIADATAENMDAFKMPEEVAAAYEVLQKQAHLNSAGGFVGAGVGREPFDAGKSFRAVEDDVVSFSGSGFSWGGLLWPLRQLSFWKMKDRARVFGQRSGFPFLCDMQKEASNARFHLVGHSFGCVAASATVAGPDAPNCLPRPIDSLVLLQATMGLWAFAAARPGETPAGYFNSITCDARVAGPTVVTYSENDSALVRVYPMAAGIAGQVSFSPGKLPKYGAAGAYGLRGPGLRIVDGEMLDVKQDYEFQPGAIHNLDSGNYIKRGWGLLGAHNNIATPEVAHAALQAMM